MTNLVRVIGALLRVVSLPLAVTSPLEGLPAEALALGGIPWISQGAPVRKYGGQGKKRFRALCVPMVCIGKRSGKVAPLKMRFSAGSLTWPLPKFAHLR